MVWAVYVAYTAKTVAADVLVKGFYLTFYMSPESQSRTYPKLATAKYKRAPVSHSETVAFHPAACACSIASDKELIKADETRVLALPVFNSFHIGLLLLYVSSHGVINTFNFFWNISWGYGDELTSKAFDLMLIGFA